ncbi:MAG: AmmeMemoRadiSam system protein A [Nitrospira sp.]|nr:AmmeMemoRadiSam system protein A [Nitrospira sp.]
MSLTPFASLSLSPITRHPSLVTLPSPHPLVWLATEAIETFLVHRRLIEPPARLYADMPEALKPAAVFVCLKREGRLRGCIGTTEPLRDTLAREVIDNAVGAATRDPRFPALEPSELDALRVSIDVLGPAEPVQGPDELDHRRYGIILRSGERRSVLLPAIEGVESVSEQIRAARDKAGLGPGEPIELLRFEVTRYCDV